MAEKVRPTNWSKKKLVEWLVLNPIVDDSDRKYLISQERVLYTACLSKIASSTMTATPSTNTQRAPAWNGHLPYLRMYLCSIMDDVKSALAYGANSMARQELDARNSSNRPDTYEEVVARLYNDDEYVPSTESLPELHAEFADPIELPFNEMPGGSIDAEDVKKKVTEARAKVMQASSRNIWQLYN